MATERRTFVHAASQVYNSVGFDLGWHEKTPDDDEFVESIIQFMEVHGGLNAAELRDWQALTLREKEVIVLEAGP